MLTAEQIIVPLHGAQPESGIQARWLRSTSKVTLASDPSDTQIKSRVLFACIVDLTKLVIFF